MEEQTLYLDCKYIGQVHKTILIFSSTNFLIFIDQHAAYEQILFESNQNLYTNSKKNKEYTYPKYKQYYFLNNEEYNIIKNNIFLMKDLGFNITLETNKKIRLDSYLSYYLKLNLLKVIKMFVKEYNSLLNYNILKENFLKSYFQMKSCRYSIKSGEFITKKQAYSLLYNLRILKNNKHCPHGRPVTHYMKINHLMKYFLRYDYSKII